MTATYIFDFETTKSNPTRVWLWCGVEMESEKRYLGYDIDSFFDFLLQLTYNCDIYFHNLSFDGSFILCRCVDFGFSFVEGVPKNNMEVGTLISDTGQWYGITIRLMDRFVSPVTGRYKKRSVKIRILDSLKKLPGTVKEIAKAYGTGVIKGECDHNIARPIGYIPTEAEIEYCYTDCIIISRALKACFQEDELFQKKITVASYALQTLKDTLSQWKQLFPVLDKETDDIIRKAYKGGYVYLNPKYRNKEVHGLTFDVNSMYPWIMSEYPLPTGYPHIFTGSPPAIPGLELYIVTVRCDFKLKSGKLPMVQLKNNFRFPETEYLSDSEDECPELHFTSIDHKLFIENYDIWNVEYIGGLLFRPMAGIFSEFVELNMKIKREEKGVKRQLAKLRMNSCYGKMATNPERRHKIPHIEDGVLQFTDSEVEVKASVYTACAAFITSYARCYLVKCCQDNIHRFIYCDTDSLHLYGYEDPEGLKIHPTELGAWKRELTFHRGKFLRPKTYVEMERTIKKVTKLILKHTTLINKRKYKKLRWDPRTEFSCMKTEWRIAGAKEEVKSNITFDTFRPGAVFEGNLKKRQVVGGCILEPSTYIINRYLDDLTTE